MPPVEYGMVGINTYSISTNFGGIKGSTREVRDRGLPSDQCLCLGGIYPARKRTPEGRNVVGKMPSGVDAMWWYR